MKKLLILLAVASLGFVSCNSGSSDADAEAKRIADSTHVADSLAKVAAESTPVMETPVTPPTDTTAVPK